MLITPVLATCQDEPGQRSCLQNVDNAGVDNRYEFDEESWDALEAASVSWLDVMVVLYGRPQLRQHVGSDGLIITGRMRNGRWLMVGLTERPGRDDVYVVRQAARLSQDQEQMIEKRMGGGPR